MPAFYQKGLERNWHCFPTGSAEFGFILEGCLLSFYGVPFWEFSHRFTSGSPEVVSLGGFLDELDGQVFSGLDGIAWYFRELEDPVTSYPGECSVGRVHLPQPAVEVTEWLLGRAAFVNDAVDDLFRFVF